MTNTTISPPLPTTVTGDAAHPRKPLPAWMREPLLHFVVLGGLLFAFDQFVVGRSADPNTIVVSEDVDSQARDLFKASRGRLPTEQELDALRRTWLDNEVLYREGLALQVDKGDAAIRERVIFKALSVVDASVAAPPPDEKALRAWFEMNRAKYDEPARFDFQEAVLSGDTSEGAVRLFVERLNRGTPGDVSAGLRVFKGRPRANLVESYGAEFTHSLQESPPGEWRAVRSRDGWRAIRLESIAPAKPGRFENLRGMVLQDWTDARMAEQRTAAVRALGKKYTVRFEAASR